MNGQDPTNQVISTPNTLPDVFNQENMHSRLQSLSNQALANQTQMIEENENSSYEFSPQAHYE